MIVENADGTCAHWTSASSSPQLALANALKPRASARVTALGVFLSQGAELTLCHLAGYRMGAVVLPLFTLFGEEALGYRMANARPRR